MLNIFTCSWSQICCAVLTPCSAPKRFLRLIGVVASCMCHLRQHVSICLSSVVPKWGMQWQFASNCTFAARLPWQGSFRHILVARAHTHIERSCEPASNRFEPVPSECRLDLFSCRAVSSQPRARFVSFALISSQSRLDFCELCAVSSSFEKTRASIDSSLSEFRPVSS